MCDIRWRGCRTPVARVNRRLPMQPKRNPLGGLSRIGERSGEPDHLLDRHHRGSRRPTLIAAAIEALGEGRFP